MKEMIELLKGKVRDGELTLDETDTILFFRWLESVREYQDGIDAQINKLRILTSISLGGIYEDKE